MDYRIDVTKRYLRVLEYVKNNQINGITNGGQFLESVGEVQQNRTKLENGTRYPTINQLVATSKIYNVSMNWLMLGEGKMIVDKAANKRLVDAEMKLKAIAEITKDYQ